MIATGGLATAANPGQPWGQPKVKPGGRAAWSSQFPRRRGSTLGTQPTRTVPQAILGAEASATSRCSGSTSCWPQCHNLLFPPGQLQCSKSLGRVVDRPRQASAGRTPLRLTSTLPPCAAHGRSCSDNLRGNHCHEDCDRGRYFCWFSRVLRRFATGSPLNAMQCHGLTPLTPVSCTGRPWSQRWATSQGGNSVCR